ncbi:MULTISPECIES: DUF6868 family protein [unclassified Lentimonas]|uniref:DUF6868 family protein n=1 Tax=unclassified Lentimonas TaxID=2630993 RepID=UPI00138A3626|nr:MULTISPECIES: hypothetical protein [unclassified Lentimonas]
MDIETLTSFFMWCTVLNGGLLIYAALMCVFASDFIYRIHSRWFPMSKQAFTIVLYSWLGLFKIGFFIFNVVPLLALWIIG